MQSTFYVGDHGFASDRIRVLWIWSGLWWNWNQPKTNTHPALWQSIHITMTLSLSLIINFQVVTIFILTYFYWPLTNEVEQKFSNTSGIMPSDSTITLTVLQWINTRDFGSKITQVSIGSQHTLVFVEHQVSPEERHHSFSYPWDVLSFCIWDNPNFSQASWRSYPWFGLGCSDTIYV